MIEEPLLSVRDLRVTFPPRRGRPAVRAVEGVSFDLRRGETLGLVGESGSGKTTTGRAVLQLQRPSAGSVRLLGRELTDMASGDLRAMRRHMQFVLQNPYTSLHPRMTVGQILSEPLAVHRAVPPNRRAERVAELLSLVHLDPKVVDRYPHEFSGGQRQRIVIARALAVNPDLVVCDEPVSALDVRTQAQIVQLLSELQDKLGLSYLFIAHDLAIVRSLAHRLAVMFGGRIVELGDADRIYETPVHPYTQSLLDAVPIPDPALQRARLARVAPEPHIPRHEADLSPCCFGEDHRATGRPRWHEVGPGHHVSCHFWPTAQAGADGANAGQG
ncbi:ATP-binding cassette domain-containing protein [Alsobacter sp. SYSU M60028]|uniref:ATP-binding cassette domain-containing protein n=1 Tax=Alsobacter ponti TaxID=2962936 RepID=A0ABT1LAF9_9HYPH|nr:oligopeptide/dipeptide ABC transporter ATP-binding protein [Alsobacter ponti]MCP8937745.1 ATP-binding cassette domain-containing protein [Alsobacter ponti]